MDRPRRRALRPCLESLDDRCLLSGLTPAQVSGAYGLNAVSVTSGTQTVKGDGTGQTIAIVDAYHDPNLVSDLQTFDQTYGLPSAQVSQVYASGTASDSGWASEETLDVEWAHAMAPGAKIVVVEAKSSSLNDLLAAVNTARNTAGVSVVSMSWGTSEFSGETSYDSTFTTPAGHTPITFVASTGDSSAWAGAQWPAVSPNVVSVGGTSLAVGGSNSYGGESAWSSGGGGVSALESLPSYQSGVTGTSTRSSPDVAAVADPNTGLSVYTTSPTTGRGTWQVVGGTSAGAPIWAALIAVADQGRALSGQSTLNGATQTLPMLYAAPSTAFHDVTSGSNGYRATTGYDLATGLGSPNAPNLIAYLDGTSTSTGTGSGAGTGTGTTTGTTTTGTTTGTGGGWQGWGWNWGWDWGWGWGWGFSWSGGGGWAFVSTADGSSSVGSLGDWLGASGFGTASTTGTQGVVVALDTTGNDPTTMSGPGRHHTLDQAIFELY